MDGMKINSVNDTMDNVISELKFHSSNLDMYINVLSFARKTKWMYKQPVKVDDFIWNILTASGMTSLGNACKQLAKNIDKHVNDEAVSVILLSDGCPTDDFDEGLEKLESCLSQKNSTRYAIALEGADMLTLNKFTGNEDNVFAVESLDNLMGLILSVINTENKQQLQASTFNDSYNGWD
jgi:uncharacterized protein YegL